MQERQKRILVAEDEKPYSRALELKLQHAGFEPKVAFDGEQALAALTSEKFDLLLLDLMMPKLNGFAVLEALKEKSISVPTIVLSNLSQEEDKHKVKAYGIEDFIEKSSTSISDVISKVNRLLTAK